MTLATPVSISANTTYIASYHTNGAYVATDNFFTNAFLSGGLTAPSSASSGGNGVYSYGGTSTAGVFPTNTFSAANYCADVVFSDSTGGTDRPPVAVADSGFTTTRIPRSVSGSALLANDSDPDGTLTDHGRQLAYGNRGQRFGPSPLTDFNAPDPDLNGTPTIGRCRRISPEDLGDGRGGTASETFHSP